jgi:hypothetical protein
MQVTMADGGQMQFSLVVPQISWWTQGHTFSSSARVLYVKCYDLIVGMDWLEQFSPMRV